MRTAVIVSILLLLLGVEILSLTVLCGWVYYAVFVLFREAGRKGY